jgi:translation initiation factor IF-2
MNHNVVPLLPPRALRLRRRLLRPRRRLHRRPRPRFPRATLPLRRPPPPRPLPPRGAPGRHRPPPPPPPLERRHDGDRLQPGRDRRAPHRPRSSSPRKPGALPRRPGRPVGVEGRGPSRAAAPGGRGPGRAQARAPRAGVGRLPLGGVELPALAGVRRGRLALPALWRAAPPPRGGRPSARDEADPAGAGRGDPGRPGRSATRGLTGPWAAEGEVRPTSDRRRAPYGGRPIFVGYRRRGEPARGGSGDGRRGPRPAMGVAAGRGERLMCPILRTSWRPSCPRTGLGRRPSTWSTR